MLGKPANLASLVSIPESARKLESGETLYSTSLWYQLTRSLPLISPFGLPSEVFRAAALAARVCTLHQTLDFSHSQSAIALVFRVPLHCAWIRRAWCGCNAGREAAEAGLSILKDFPSRYSRHDVLAPSLMGSDSALVSLPSRSNMDEPAGQELRTWRSAS